MKILHICLANFYIDNFSYQENMLPKYHKILGNDVEILASLVTFDVNGKLNLLDKPDIYMNENDIQVTRLKYKRIMFSKTLRLYVGAFTAINESKPDIIFIHGCQFMDIKEVIKFIKLFPKTIIYVDNHADFSNSATNWLSKNILHKIIWRGCAKSIEKYTRKYYGVLPARVDFLNEIYGINLDKIELLVMGADDEQVQIANRPDVLKSTRSSMSINPADFVIITCGKIDSAKKQTFLLMEAVKEILDPNVKLYIFGSVTKELKEEFQRLLVPNKVIYLGWADTRQSYRYMAVADLAIFPGRHSVYWEQAVGSGIPCIFKYWKGTTHVDLGGNCLFLTSDSVIEIKSKIQQLIENDDTLIEMKKVAQLEGVRRFSYLNIAQESVETNI